MSEYLMKDDRNLKNFVIISGNRTEKEIIEPLKSTGVHSFEYIEIKDDFPKKIEDLFLFPIAVIKKYRKGNRIFLTDTGGFYLLILCLLSSFLRIRIILKIKGDTFLERHRNIRFEKERRNSLGYIYHSIKYFVDIISYPRVELYLPVSKWIKNQVNKKFENIVLTKYNTEILRTPVYNKDLPKKTSYKKKENFRILTVTNFDFDLKIKGLKIFLEKYHAFLQKMNAKIDIAGNGKHLEEYKKKFNYENITYLGYKNNLEQLYKKYDLLVHFSYLDGYPTTVLEAQGAKLPVMTNNCCGMKEQIEDGETGYLVDLDDNKGVEEKLSTLINSEEERKRIGENGYNKVKKENNPRKIGRNLNKSIKLLLKK